MPLNALPEETSPEALERSEKDVSEPISNGPSEKGVAALIWPAHMKDGQHCRDMTLFVDDDGKCYHIYASEHNSTLHVAELSEDYLSYTPRWWRITPKDWTEAPAVCKRRGWYYLVGSGCTGWKPNEARYYRAKELCGPWQRCGNPAKGVNPANRMGPESTWGGQSTFIIPPCPATGNRYIAMFDIWRPQNAIDGRYMWLPMEFDQDGFLSIPFVSE